MTQSVPLPYVPTSFPGELLSSWLRRVAAEYGVTLTHLAAHLGLSVSQPWEIDRVMPGTDVCRLANAVRAAPTEIRNMVYSPVQVLSPTTVPIQVCAPCRARHRAQTQCPVAIRSWFEFWRIECQHCHTPFAPSGGPKLGRSNPAREEPGWFESIRPAARAGADLLERFARRRFSAGPSPVDVLRLLSMRFDAVEFSQAPVARRSFTERYAIRRLAELFVTGLSERREDDLLPEAWTAEKPVRLVTARTILLAGMANFLRNHRRGIDLVQSAAACVHHRGFADLLSDIRRIDRNHSALVSSISGHDP